MRNEEEYVLTITSGILSTSFVPFILQSFKTARRILSVFKPKHIKYSPALITTNVFLFTVVYYNTFLSGVFDKLKTTKNSKFCSGVQTASVDLRNCLLDLSDLNPAGTITNADHLRRHDHVGIIGTQLHNLDMGS